MLFFHLKLVHGVKRWTVEKKELRGKFSGLGRKMDQEVEVCFPVSF